MKELNYPISINGLRFCFSILSFAFFPAYLAYLAAIGQAPLFHGGLREPATQEEIIFEWALSALLFLLVIFVYRRFSKTGHIRLTENSITMPVSLKEGPDTVPYSSIEKIELAYVARAGRVLMIWHNNGFIKIPEIRLQGIGTLDEIHSYLIRHVYQKPRFVRNHA